MLSRRTWRTSTHSRESTTLSTSSFSNIGSHLHFHSDKEEDNNENPHALHDHDLSGHSSPLHVDLPPFKEGDHELRWMGMGMGMGRMQMNFMKKQLRPSIVYQQGSKPQILITILVAAKGTHKLPSINGAEDLKRTLQKLRSLLSKHLLAGEVLWTPQKDDDTLSEEELIEDYPKLAKSMGNFLAKKKE
ncbi:hypothetical protein HN873_000629 [Arachis hypogaea]